MLAFLFWLSLSMRGDPGQQRGDSTRLAEASALSPYLWVHPFPLQTLNKPVVFITVWLHNTYWDYFWCEMHTAFSIQFHQMRSYHVATTYDFSTVSLDRWSLLGNTFVLTLTVSMRLTSYMFDLASARF